MTTQPQVIVLAGPNGAGKSTAAEELLPEGIIFVNADEIAKGLANYPSRSVDIQAGRLALEQLVELERRRVSFAVETTLASKSLASRIVRLREGGDLFNLLFLWSPSPDLSIQRVAERVRRGGHSIPEETIRRRYTAGLRNFFDRYQPIADFWHVYDTSRGGSPRLIAEGKINGKEVIRHANLWRQFRRGLRDE